MTIDQVKFAAPRNAAEADAFKPVKTMDALVGLLQSKNAQFERAQTTLDTAGVPDEALAKLRQTSASGEPLVVIRGPVAVANVIVGEKPAPGGSMEGVTLAKQRLGQERLEAAMRQRQDSLRKGADIKYADGYKPKPGTPGAAAAPTK
ncbi:MAG: hypothetical protein EOP19_15630 [Hyphomicrobiales bacterium]|nr:MAG: hypothetical protein EOP19_15630 [Hyphomicrobiales bacterium]